MNDLATQRLTEIKDRLRRIDAPWHVRYTDDQAWMAMTTITKRRTDERHDGECYDDCEDAEDTVAIVFHQSSPVVEPDENDENAEFIANAPADIRWLVEQLETRL